MGYSYLSIQTSKAGFTEFTKQITDTVRYLKRNRKKLEHISLTKEVDVAVLNFGIELMIDQNMYPSKFFPVALLKLAADLNIGIEFTNYPV